MKYLKIDVGVCDEDDRRIVYDGECGEKRGFPKHHIHAFLVVFSQQIGALANPNRPLGYVVEKGETRKDFLDGWEYHVRRHFGLCFLFVEFGGVLRVLVHNGEKRVDGGGWVGVEDDEEVGED
jgi:hypothetical protein